MSNLAKKAIILLEDDFYYADSLAKLITGEFNNYLEVIVIDDPRKAILIIDQQNPSLIIADLHLGETNFITLLNELASYPDTMSIPKVILSSSGDKINIDDFRQYGVMDVYDKKRFDVGELLNTIRNQLELK